MKRKEFLMSLGLISIAPKLLSKNVVNEPVEIKEINPDLLTLTITEIAGLDNILNYDMVWIMKPSGNDDAQFVPVVEGHVISRFVSIEGIAKIEVATLRHLDKFNKKDEMFLYHWDTVLSGKGTHSKIFPIKSIES